MNFQLTLIPWRWVFLYYAVAIGLAIPCNLGWLAPWFNTHLPGTILARWPFLPAAIGPAIGAILAQIWPTARPYYLTARHLRFENLCYRLNSHLLFSLVDINAALYAFVALIYATDNDITIPILS